MTDNAIDPSTSDEELMLRYKLGEEAAFHVLYTRHEGKVYGYLSSRLKGESLVDDVFQESFLKLHKFRSQYVAGSPFLPWFFTICRNTMLDHMRQKVRTADTTPLHEESAEKKSVNLRDLKEGIGNLSAQEINILDQHYRQGYTFQELSSTLNIQAANARQIASRALKKLRAFFRDEL